MRNAYLPIALVLTGMALAAPAAAPAFLEVSELTHCPQMENTSHVVEGGCEMHLTTDENLVIQNHAAGAGEFVFASCSSEFDARVGEGGHGFIYNQALSGGSCDLEPCAEAGGSPQLAWPFSSMETAGTEGLFMTFCAARLGVPVGCSIATTIVTDGPQDYEIRASGQRCSHNADVSINVHWNIEGAPIQIAH